MHPDTNNIFDIEFKNISEFAKSNIINHVESSALPIKFKEILLEEIHKEKNPFYFCYASLFTAKESELINSINMAGYFYYKYLIATDGLVDNKIAPSKNPFKNLIKSNYYHEESIRILSQIFSSHPEFWNCWGTRKSEYLHAFQTDIEFLDVLSELEFQKLADCKSANGKVAIDSLYICDLINKKDYEALLASHKLFSCGFQYYDDVIDLKQDILNKQTNISLCELKRSLQSDIFSSALEDPEKMNKLSYVKGIAGTLLAKSIDCFNEAEHVVESIDCELWKQAIRIKKQEVKAVLQNVNYYLTALNIKIKLSKQKIQTSSLVESNFEEAVLNGVDFIAREQESNGNWKDSPVNTWLSGYWTTGYVLNSLANCESEAASRISTGLSVEFLKSKRGKAWPYITGWVEDADSTNFAILGLVANNQIVDKEINELLTYQKKNGGYTTYNKPNTLLNFLNDPKIKDVSGWTQSHVCVSAGTLLVLSKFPSHFKDEKNKLIKYLLSNISTEGIWESYWWTSPIYCSSLIIQASIAVADEDLFNAAGVALSVLMLQQQENGLFADDFSNKHIFYSAMLLQTCCSCKTFFEKYSEHVKILANALIREQNSDGSWDSSFALRVPAANCIDPKYIKSWRKSDLGENVIIEDIHRIITTSTVISALSLYNKLK